jgi:hypothetical protein
MGTHAPLVNKAASLAGLLVLATSAVSNAAELKQEILQCRNVFMEGAVPLD